MTKDDLKRYCGIKREADDLRGRLEELEARMIDPKVPVITGMPGGGSGDRSRQERIADSTQELRDLYKEKIAQLDAEALLIEDAINSCDPIERDLLRLRYIDGKQWEKICVLRSYSWRQVHRIHSRALIKLAAFETMY